jgi:Sec-independent protein translocase protein TatA
VLLRVVGAKRLPEMGRSLGSGLRGFKDAISGEAADTAATAAAPAQLGEAAQPAPAKQSPAHSAAPHLDVAA